MNKSAPRVSPSISTRGLATVTDHIGLYRSLARSGFTGGRPLRVALLASSTINGLREVLFLKCAEAQIRAEIHVGGYDQIAQEALDSESPLYAFKPEVVIVFADAQALLGDRLFDPYAPSDEERQAWLDGRLADLKACVAAIRERSGAVVLLHDLEVPVSTPLGPLENRRERGFIEQVRRANEDLRRTYREDPGVFVLEYDAFCSSVGKSRLRDPKLYYLADMKVGLDHIPALASLYLSYLRPLAGLARKCLVVDLDNTLWGGVLGEDGLEGIRIGPTTEGRPYLELQRLLLGLSRRGVILAINSRNNEDEALEALAKHPGMALRSESFAAMRINWEDKASNLRALASELSIGLDSMVFLDDDPANRQLVREQLPEVEVVELPEDSAQYPAAIAALDCFGTLQLTAEDLAKSRQYAERRQRRDLEACSTDLTQFLRSLEMVVCFREADRLTLPRIAQLTQKTNQFNMTSRRYTEAQLQSLLAGGRHLIFSAKVSDKFGDNGICGAVIAETSGREWRIDTFLLSCRVIGRKVEDAMLAHLGRRAREAGAESLLGEFVATERNEPAVGFYAQAGFEAAEPGRWRRRLEPAPAHPSFITIKEDKA